MKEGTGDNMKMKPMKKTEPKVKDNKPKITQREFKRLLIKHSHNGIVPKQTDIKKILDREGYQSHNMIISELNSKLLEKGFLERGRYSKLNIKEIA